MSREERITTALALAALGLTVVLANIGAATVLGWVAR